ncbi:hypothetical protein BDQ12DRAFT_687374 [Crucibulum laeve]|uniref:Uncharacterized protein n=1 Tax=Crucibulum laeve TaxID=68775 RepID=A0A5C3LTQ6_9AGAR|nr:hypothetical protein BDQ12DRAFT_687374 [Crucibulum laeve]
MYMASVHRVKQGSIAIISMSSIPLLSLLEQDAKSLRIVSTQALEILDCHHSRSSRFANGPRLAPRHAGDQTTAHHADSRSHPTVDQRQRTSASVSCVACAILCQKHCT